ncbi:MAG: hypothetical protein PHW98_03640 [Candidatus Omnitrophica bacterium]|nr:hypothetical protein [Candidatus Omnitrophota bacterium]MDD5771726.1 hypothetical protein [Candidatus Omnitrophota bacterium]
MRKLLLVLFAAVFISPLCLAQQDAEEVNKPAFEREVVPTFNAKGRVSSMIIGDFSKGIKSQLVFMTNYGRSLSLSVSAETAITDKDGKAIALNDIKKDSQIAIVYTMGKRVNRAQSIQLME